MSSPLELAKSLADGDDVEVIECVEGPTNFVMIRQADLRALVRVVEAGYGAISTLNTAMWSWGEDSATGRPLAELIAAIRAATGGV